MQYIQATVQRQRSAVRLFFSTMVEELLRSYFVPYSITVNFKSYRQYYGLSNTKIKEVPNASFRKLTWQKSQI